MKKKILIIALVSIMLISAMGISSVFATENESTPELDIYKHNLSFDDTIYLLYAVDAQNVDKSDVELLLWTEPQSEYTADNAKIKLSSAGTTKIDEKTCLVFEYKDLAAKQMTDYVYARAHVEKGGKDYYSEVSKYSILTYAYTKLGKIDPDDATNNEDLKALLTDMLGYGASAQKYFGYKTDTLATDEFYNVKVVGGTLSDGFSEGLYEKGSDVILTATQKDGELTFSSWRNASGTKVSDSYVFKLTVTDQNDTYTACYGEAVAYSEGLGFELLDDESYCVINIGKCSDSNIVIPSTYQGLHVTQIADYAFEGNAAITTVTIPETVTSIGDGAFQICPGLTSVTIQGKRTSIGELAFNSCSELDEIFFNGTKTQWEAIEKGDCWDYDTGNYTIHCTDGDIAKE